MTSQRGTSAWARIRNMYAVFGPYTQPYRRDIAFAYLALAISVAASALRPWPLKYVLDSVILRKTFADPYLTLAVLCALLVVLAAVESTAGYFQKLLFARVGHSVTTDVLERTFTHLQTLPRSERVSNSGDLIVRLTSDVKTIRDLLVEHLQKVGTYALTLITTALVMFGLDLRLTLIGLSIVPVIWLVSWRFSRAIRKAARRKRQQEGAVASAVHENLGGLVLIQAFAREEHERRRFRKQAEQSLEANVESSRLGGAFSRAVEVLSTLGAALVIGFGAVQVLQGKLSPGTLVVFAAYMHDLYKPIQNLSELSVKFLDSLVSAERVLEVLQTSPRVHDRRGAVRAPAFKGEIVFERVTFGYLKDKPVLKDLSIHFAPGETVAIVGSSGSGKSTIINLLLRFYEPWQGRILIDGVDIRHYKVRSLREQIGVVLQEPFLFRRSVFENISYGKSGAGLNEVIEAARAARADDFIRKLPDGYETVLSELGQNLSGGQRQRIALARAFLRDAPVFVFDEATSSLDAVTESELKVTLDELAQSKTTIMIAHQLSTVENADRILVLEDGRISHQCVSA